MFEQNIKTSKFPIKFSIFIAEKNLWVSFHNERRIDLTYENLQTCKINALLRKCIDKIMNYSIP